MDLQDVARKALARLDLTNLKEDCTPEQIDALCAKAISPFGPTAAICIWPRFVAQARAILGASSPVRIATVVNFPSGNASIKETVAETSQAIADGADEIDLVIPYRALIAGDEAATTAMVRAVKQACPDGVWLKTILETGEIGDPVLIRKASDLALAAGADFIKTSTGKVKVNATLAAAEIMLTAIAATGGKAGFKPAGGISTVEDAAAYLALADRILAADWASPRHFRFGASGLLDDILAVLSGTGNRATGQGY